VLEGLFVRDGKLLPAFPATACKNAATIGRGHSFTETVLILSLPARGLIGAFHRSEVLNSMLSPQIPAKGLQIWAGFGIIPITRLFLDFRIQGST
jgi:hypothetical protein